MAGTKQNARIEDIRKIFHKKWPDYLISGSLPHDKGVMVFRKGSGNSLPVLTQTFEKNYDLFLALLNPQYHPGKVWPPLNTGQGSLFSEVTEYVLDSTRAQLMLLENTLDKCVRLKETLLLYDKTFPERIINELKIIYNKINKSK